jgi:hypothetical protein
MTELRDAAAVVDLVAVRAGPLADRRGVFAVRAGRLVRHRGRPHGAPAAAAAGLAGCADERGQGVTELGRVLVGQVDLVLAAVE